MRLIPIVATAWILWIPASAVAQEWIEYANQQDRFTANFYGQPTVTATTYKSEFGANLPARVYRADAATGKYSITVVDYTNIEQILTEKSKSCPVGAETCRGGAGDTGYGYWRVDRQGALVYAVWNFLQRDAKLTHLNWNFAELVEGQQLQLTNPDKSRTFASVYMHENKLFIVEATVPGGFPEPGWFQQSLGFIDEQGRGIRYESFYLNGGPKPGVRFRGAGNQGRISAPGAPEQ